MNNVSSARLTVPKAASNELPRQALVEKIMDRRHQFVAVEAGAGYGKTTLLSQGARGSKHAVWFSLAGESDIFTFANTLCEAIRQSFPEYSFMVSEYLPFLEKENFVTIIANALIGSIEALSDDILLIFDDIHTIKDNQIKETISCFIRFAPENIRLCLGSREALWQQLVPFCARGRILEIKQNELAFSQEETSQVLGFDDTEIFGITEGWPLAVGSLRVLLENGVSPGDITFEGKETLYSYLFYECISRLPSKMVEFLTASACFVELDAPMLDSVLGIKNSRLMLESLAARNIFTMKTDGGYYRYHALFKKCLIETGEEGRLLTLRQKAALYYYDKKDFGKAAEYSISLNNMELLQKVILASYRDFIKSGRFSELRHWFSALGDDLSASQPEIFLAKGAFLSCVGNFTEAQKYLDAAIPLLGAENKELYIEAMVHKARVLRNFISFEASNELLDRILPLLGDDVYETTYCVVIEILYNFCMNSQILKARALAQQMIEKCSRAGNLKIKAWFERYLCAICFFAGSMKETVYYYEKSHNLPEEEQEYLEMHGIDIYAAKAYQLLGDRERSLSILAGALQKMRSRGIYEELWFGYLFAAEIYYQNTVIDKTNGKAAHSEAMMKYFTLADEYAPLYRKTDFQMQWAKMQRLTYSLMFTDGPKDDIIKTLLRNVKACGSYLKLVVYSRLMGYYAATGDMPRSAACARRCVAIGSSAGMFMLSALAYGILARAALAKDDNENARLYTGLNLRLSYSNGIYAYFKARKDYDHLLQFAFDNAIEPEITSFFMEFAGYKTKKAYIKTFGGFCVFPFKDRVNTVKMRTRKERELFAFLLDAGEQGASKEEIYDAIWSESDSENIKRLIGVNLAQIKKDLAGLGIENSVLCREKRYSISRDEIVCDFELFEKAAEAGNPEKDEAAFRIASLYTGEYLSDFEAFWATPKRINYQKIYNAAKARH